MPPLSILIDMSRRKPRVPDRPRQSPAEERKDQTLDPERSVDFDLWGAFAASWEAAERAEPSKPARAEKARQPKRSSKP